MAIKDVQNAILKWLKLAISPDPKPRRDLAPGFQKEGLFIWGILMVLFLTYQLFLAGNSYTLFLPKGIRWVWHEVHLPVVDFWTSFLCLFYFSGICLFPRLFTRISAIAFSGYFLYGAANGAHVDLLLGFGESLYDILKPILPAGTKGAVSWLWGPLKFPTLGIYSFDYFLSLYIFFTAILTFIYFPAGEHSPRRRPSSVDIILFVFTLIILINYVVNFAARGERAGVIEWHDVIMGILAVVISIEMCRRLIGWVLPALAILFCLYAIFGYIIPGPLNHAGFSFNEVMAFVFSTEGVFGDVAGVFATYVFLFILFGAVLEAAKVGDVFVKLAFACVGSLGGGPAKAAVVSSGLVGMVIGSGAANIVITGTFTIPMMRRAGFTPAFAAAVEAVASIGGILMPPVMGATAFLIAAYTDISYNHIIFVSFVPALMYYFQCYMSVHHRAGLRGIEGIPRKELPQLKVVLKKEGYLLLPILLLILRLIIGRSPFDAALWAMLLAVTLGFFRDDTRIIGFPPLIADLIHLPKWRTDVDWARVKAERTKAALLSKSRPPEEIEAECYKIIAEAVDAPRRGIVQENWMLWVGIGIFFALIAAGFTIGSALFWAIASIGVFSSPKVLQILEKGAQNSLIIGVTAGVVGVMLAGMDLPSLGLKFPSIVIGYSRVFVHLFGWTGSELPMSILLCGVAAYVMGMGMTPLAAYILLSILAAPALIQLGVPLLNAHMIVFWFTITAPLTPPFALGAFVAAGIAHADPMKTGFTAVRLAWALYIVPFLMAYTPILMNNGSSWLAIGSTWVTCFMGFYSCAVGLEGYLRRKLFLFERFIFLASAFLLFSDTPARFLMGMLLLALGIIFQYVYKPPQKAAVTTWASKNNH
jgi:TRAP transporter 4TM/12TM fusion protein